LKGGKTLIRPRVLLADDHPALLKATTALLKLKFDVVGTATDGATLVSEALRLCPDVIVADITMPVLSGIDAARWLRESSFPAKIVFLTIHSEEQFIKACIAEGALGYVLKSHMKAHMKAHLIPAVEAALLGRVYVCPFVPM
jgi:DNA-binding NarL/FixJ family response regulator